MCERLKGLKLNFLELFKTKPTIQHAFSLYKVIGQIWFLESMQGLNLSFVLSFITQL